MEPSEVTEKFREHIHVLRYQWGYVRGALFVLGMQGVGKPFAVSDAIAALTDYVEEVEGALRQREKPTSSDGSQ